MQKIASEIRKNLLNSGNSTNGAKPVVISLEENKNKWISQKGGIIFFQVLVAIICVTFFTIGLVSHIKFTMFQGFFFFKKIFFFFVKSFNR